MCEKQTETRVSERHKPGFRVWQNERVSPGPEFSKTRVSIPTSDPWLMLYDLTKGDGYATLKQQAEERNEWICNGMMSETCSRVNLTRGQLDTCRLVWKN